MSSEQPLAHALHKGQVCGGGCLMNALLGYAFTAFRMGGKKVRGWSKGFSYSREAGVCFGLPLHQPG